MLRARLRGGSLHKAAKGELRLPLPAGFEYDETRAGSGSPRTRRSPTRSRRCSRYFDGARERPAGDAAAAGGGPPAAAQGRLATGRCAGRRRPTRRSTRSSPTPSTRAPTRTGASRPSGASRTAWSASASAARRARTGTCASRTTTPATSPSSATWPTSSGCAPTGARRAARAAAPPREGRALLQGLVRCGRCGRRMQVGYSGKTLVPNYSCVRGNQLYGSRALPVGRRPADRAGRARRRVRGAAPGRDRGDAQGIEHASSDHRARVRSAELELERAADPRRARPPPVRRLRAREPARRPHARARMGAAPDRGPPRRARPGRGRTPSAPTRSPTRRSPGADKRAPTCARCSTRPPPAIASASSCCARSSPTSS